MLNVETLRGKSKAERDQFGHIIGECRYCGTPIVIREIALCEFCLAARSEANLIRSNRVAVAIPGGSTP